jgi:hypothetical protein
VKPATIEPGRRPPTGLVGAVLARDVVVSGERWAKGRRISAEDLAAIAAAGVAATVLVPDAGEIHEDEAAVRLGRAVRGEGLQVRGPAQSRLDLLAAVDGVLHVRTAALERLNRIDPLEVFTAFDGQVVETGDLVASVKIAPHLVPVDRVALAERIALRGGPVVRVAPFVAQRVGVVVKERLGGPARERFERSIRDKIERLGSEIISITYVADDPAAVRPALRALSRGAGKADLILTAGAGSTDPTDSVFLALDQLGGRIVRQGVPAHPGSMLWLARLGRTAVLGLPTCGAYSKATAADLLLPRLLSGEPASTRTVAALGHGGILSRHMRFRFPPYARELEAPEG